MFGDDMLYENADIKLCSVIKAPTNMYKVVNARQHNGFYFKLSGSVIYTIDGMDYVIKENDFIFLPKGVSYTVKTIVPGDYISVNFEGECEGLQSQQLFKAASFPDSYRIFNQLYSDYSSVENEKYYLCYSELYRLLYTVLVSIRCYVPTSKYDLIRDAVNYLDKHIYDTDLKVSKLSEISGISYAYFVRLFQDFFHTSPRKFIINRRIAAAKSMLDSGDFRLVSEVSERVGYQDVLYFSRLFKKEVGIPPSLYMRR